MVKSHVERGENYVAGVDALSIYLKVKKRVHQVDKCTNVQTLKDVFAVPLIESYNLDSRLNRIALEAWRQLYYLGYSTKQVVVKISSEVFILDESLLNESVLT